MMDNVDTTRSSTRRLKRLRGEEVLIPDLEDIAMSDLLDENLPSPQPDAHDAVEPSAVPDQPYSKQRKVTIELAPSRSSLDRSSADSDADSDAGFDFIQDFPGKAGTPEKIGTTTFEEIQCTQEASWYPFTGKDEWELAKWLMTAGVSQNKRESFLKLPIVRTCSQMHNPL
jgi:hypothetical protein